MCEFYVSRCHRRHRGGSCGGSVGSTASLPSVLATFINVQARGGKGRAEAKEEKMGVLWFSLLSGAAPLQVAALELPPSQSLAARRENVTAGWALREAAAEVYFWFLCWTGSFKDVSRGKIKAYTSPVFQSAANRSCQREEIFQVLPVALPKVTDQCPSLTSPVLLHDFAWIISLCRD